MDAVDERLASAGLKIPSPGAAGGNYLPVVRSGQLLFTAGQVPMVKGSPVLTGKLGRAISVEQGQECAQICALNMLAQLRYFLGDLSGIRRVVKLTVFVAAEPSFTAHSSVANGASDLMALAFGDVGRHARSALGVGSLPLDSPVEVEAIFEVG